MTRVTFLPRLPNTFWAYLEGLDRDLERLMELLEQERLSLLNRDFKRIMAYAQGKDELLRRITGSEGRLLGIMREVLEKVDQGTSGDLNEGIEVVRAFKKILAFKDLIRFETWHTQYIQKMKEARTMNQRNQQWAEEGLRETVELSRILMGRHQSCSAKNGMSGLLYNENGKLDGRLD